jgi:hypothetical protein
MPFGITTWTIFSTPKKAPSLIFLTSFPRGENGGITIISSVH